MATDAVSGTAEIINPPNPLPQNCTIRVYRQTYSYDLSPLGVFPPVALPRTLIKTCTAEDNCSFSFDVSTSGKTDIIGEAENCGISSTSDTATLFAVQLWFTTEPPDYQREGVINPPQPYSITYFPGDAPISDFSVDSRTDTDASATIVNLKGTELKWDKDPIGNPMVFRLKEGWWYGYKPPQSHACYSVLHRYLLTFRAIAGSCEVPLHSSVGFSFRETGECKSAVSADAINNFVDNNIFRTKHILFKECCYGVVTPVADPHLYKCTVDMDGVTDDSHFQYFYAALAEEKRHCEQYCNYLPWANGGIGETFCGTRLEQAIRGLTTSGGLEECESSSPLANCPIAKQRLGSKVAQAILNLGAAVASGPDNDPGPVRCWEEYTAKRDTNIPEPFGWNCTYGVCRDRYGDFNGGQDPPQTP